MLSYLLKISLRNIWKNKVTISINVIGLTTGIAACIILALWIKHQFSFNNFLPEGDRIHQFVTIYPINGELQSARATSYPIIQKVASEIPEIDELVYLRKLDKNYVLQVGGNTFTAKGHRASSNFFRVFHREFLYGKPEAALANPLSIAISKSLASRIFGADWQSKIANEVILLDNRKPVDIAGVFEDFPENSTLRSDYLIPFPEHISDHMGNYSYQAYGKTLDADKDLLSHKINSILKEQTKAELFLQPFSDIYLYSNIRDGKINGGRIGYVQLFIAAAIFILLMACINFINLYSASSFQRTKELGIKRIIGAKRSTVIWQVISEAFFITFISMVLAIVLVLVLLPQINTFLEMKIIVPISSFSFWLKIGVLFLITGALAGVYPALLLTSFKPVNILNTNQSLKVEGVRFRRGLFIFQFLISCMLILFTYGVNHQLSFLQNKDLGFNKENIVCLALSENEIGKLDLLKSELKSRPYILDVSFCSSDLLSGSPMVGGLDWPNKDPLDSSQFGVLFTDTDFLNTMDIDVVSGGLSDDLSGTVPVVLNRLAADVMGGGDFIINNSIQVWGTNARVTGIIEDFHFNTLFTPIQPLVIANMPSQTEYLFAKVQAGREQETIALLKGLRNQYDVGRPLKYFWLEEHIRGIYQNEKMIGTVSAAFSILSLVISCLGLFGLANFNTKKRTKEISIRRVLGASSVEIIRLILSEYAKLIGISLIISIPFTYYFLNEWLSKFAYTTNLSAVSFITPVVMMMIILIVTVFYHSARASLINPSRSLRDE